MDLLSQGLVGTGMALSIAKPDEIRKAGAIGLLSGLAADVDFFISSNTDPLLNLEFHRHFTHSLLFIPVAALIISLLLWPFFAQGSAYAGRPGMATSSVRNHLPWKRIFTYSLAGYLLSGFLDACTSYGTSLFWPVSEQRFSFNIISIIDPVFTAILLLGVLLTLKTRRRIFTHIFMLLAALYLALGWFQHQTVEQLSQQIAKQRGHTYERLLVKPTLGNLFLWRSIYLHQNNFYVDAIRLNPLTGQSSIFKGESIRRFNPQQHNLKIPAESVLQRDIKRFAAFTSDYLAIDPLKQNFIIDVRYSSLPNKTTALWGIQFDPESPENHADYQVHRDFSNATREQFLSMLFNRSKL